MKKISSVLLLLLWVVALGFTQQQQSDITETITAKEKEMYEAMKSGDMNTFQSNLADDFFSAYNNGIIEREQELENIAKINIEKYELSDIHVIQPAENVAIITYALAGAGSYDEKEFDSNYYSASTWIKQDDGNWKAALHTETEAIVHEDPLDKE